MLNIEKQQTKPRLVFTETSCLWMGSTCRATDGTVMDIKMIITHTQNTCKTDTLSFTVNVQTYTTF